MQAALALARRGLGRVWPNPAVGCVLVRPDLDGRVVGRGWTQPGGRPHAEAMALQAAGEEARGATAYATLEPCAHTGDTPPCADALIVAGVARVVVATGDPDPRVDGQGLARLADAGVEVSTGVLTDEATDLNAGFISRVQHGRPLFTLKTATTLDGRIATRSGDSQWITGTTARAEGHLLRAEHDAVLTGIGTARADDPALTCRLPGMADRSPVRIVCDSGLDLSPASQLATTARDIPVLLITVNGHDAGKAAALTGLGVEILCVGNDGEGRPAPMETAKALGTRGFTRVLVEAGATLTAAFMGAGLIDRIVWFRAAKAIGGDGLGAIAELGIESLGRAFTYERDGVRECGNDLIETYRATNRG